MSLVESLKQKDGHELMQEIIHAHTEMFVHKLEDVLDTNGLVLGQDGVEVLSKILPTEKNSPEISIVYEVRKNGVMVETFGFTLDLTSSV